MYAKATEQVIQRKQVLFVHTNYTTDTIAGKEIGGETTSLQFIRKVKLLS